MTKAAKFYWALTFAVGTALTIIVNAAHAKGVLAVSGTNTAMAVAMCPPATFALLAEGYFLVRRSVPKGVQRVVKLAVGGLAVAAFAVSYETSRLFVIAEPGPLPEWTGWVIPGMLDTLVAVSGYVLYVLSSHTESAATEVRKRQGSGRWSRIAEAATRRLETKLEVPETPQVDTLAEAHGGSVEDFAEADSPSTNSSTEGFAEPPLPSTETFTEDSTKVDFPFTEDSVEPATEAPSTSTNPAAKVSTKAVSPELEPFMEAAEDMAENGLVRGKTAEEFAKIISAIEQRWSPNRIKTELGYSTSTTEKVRRAWQPRKADQHDWQLSAVG